MRSRLSSTSLIAGLALVAALVLTILRPSPGGLFKLGERNVRAAPGEPAPRNSTHKLTGLQVFNLTLVRIRDAYVDSSRISPKEMLYAALDSVQYDIPEVLVEPYRDRDEIVVVVNDKRQSFSTSEVDSPWRLAGKLKRVFRFIQANMNPGADLTKVEYAAVNGMLTTLDPHSVLLDPETARDMDVSTSGKFGGLGIVIRMYKQKLTVVRPMKGTPAQIAGIKKGDHIYSINDELTGDLTLNQAVGRMRGDPDSKIVLTVKRRGVAKPIRFEITRAVIRVESVQSEILAENVGYVKLKEFSGHAARDVKHALNALKKQGATSIVFDLRSNPGGLLEQAIKIADLFVDSGTIVTTVGGREREPRRAKRKGTDTTSPLVVLINGNSASASEIVAGALKNLDRALIVGTTSFGKGSVQLLYSNNDGSKLKLTIAQYLTPGDRSIQSVGITPDIDLQRQFVSATNSKPGDGVRLLRSERGYREADLNSHLTSRYAKQGAKPAQSLDFLYESSKASADPNANASGSSDDSEPLDAGFTEDFEIILARRLAAHAANSRARTGNKAPRRAPNRAQMIKLARGIVQSTRRQQQRKLTAAVGKLGIDWSPALGNKLAPTLVASVRFDSGSDVIAAGTVVKIIGKVTNAGTSTAYQVQARASSDDRYFDENELLFGKIEPGQSREWTSFIQVPKDAPDRLDVVKFEFRDASGGVLKADPLKFRIRSALRPVFAYSHQLIDLGNGDGLVQKQEKQRLRVQIKNTGKGVAASTTALLRNASGDGVVIKKGRVQLGSMKPGETRVAEFELEVTPKLTGKHLVIEMTVYDSQLHESVSEKLEYPVHTGSAGPTPARGHVRIKQQRAAVREGASSRTGTVGWASKGAVFKLIGKQAGWNKVDLGNGRPGFIESKSLARSGAGGGSKGAHFQPNWQVTPPALNLRVSSYETDRDHYTLRGTATDDTHVEDVYIFVSNREAKVDNKKVFYKSNRGGTNPARMEFSANVPLSPGSNRVTTVVRENGEVQSSETIYLYRTGASAKTARRHQ